MKKLSYLKSFFLESPLKTEPFIGDTTLRDGVQMLRLAASLEHTVHITHLLDDLGVDFYIFNIEGMADARILYNELA